MIRKPSSTSSSVSRPDSPMSASKAGSSAGGSTAGGSRAGTSAGSRAAMSAPPPSRGQSIDAPIAQPLPPRRPASPVMISLACAGWGTFVLLWVVVITIMINRGDTGNTALAQAANVPPPAVSAPVIPQANTPAQIPAAPPTTTPTASPRPATTTTPTTTPPPARPATTPAVTPQPTTPTPAPAAPALSSNNPFGLSRPNVLGFELKPGHTAVLLDAIERSTGWIDDGKAALMSGLTRAGASQRVSLVTTSDGNAETMLASPFAPGASRFTPLNQFLRPVQATGKGGLGAGLNAAIDTGADEVVFITSRSAGWAGYLNNLRGMLKMDSRSPIKLHIIQIGEPNNDLRQFVENECEGTYLLLTEDQLRTWRRETR